MSWQYTYKQRRWVYTLRIAGLPYRYTSGPAQSATIEGRPGSVAYTDIQLITWISDLSSSLDRLGGVAEHSNITVRLMARSPAQADGDPVRVFGRAGRRSADTYALITQTIPADAVATSGDPLTIYVDRTLAGLSYPTQVEIGQEAFWATAAAGSQPDPDVADPYRITVTARGVADTRPRDHVVRVDDNDFPILTAGAIVFWRTRPAILTAEPADGSSPAVEVMRGFIESTPSPSADGLSVDVPIVPLTALLDREVDLRVPATRVSVTQGYHWFDGVRGSEFIAFCQTPRIRGPARDASAAGADTIDAEPEFVAQWALDYDHTLPSGHPRAGDITVGGRAYRVTATAEEVGPGDDQFEVAPDLERRIRPPEGLDVPRRWEARSTRIPAGLRVWPGSEVDGADGAWRYISDALDVDTTQGADGLTYGIRLDADGQRLIARRNGGVDDPAYAGSRVALLAGVNGRPDDLPIIDYWPFGDLPSMRSPADGQSLPLPFLWELLWAPLQWVDPARQAEGGNLYLSQQNPAWEWIGLKGLGQAEITAPLYNIAPAFYSPGETVVLLDDLIEIPADGRVTLSGRDASDINNITVTITATAIEPLVLAVGPRAGDTIYKLTVEPIGLGVPAVCQWDPTSPMIVEGEQPPAGTSGDLLEFLLTSPRASGLEAGVDVDVASLHAVADPPWLYQTQLPEIPRESDIEFYDLVASILKMTRSGLMMRTSADGRCRLTRIGLGVETAIEAAATIASGDWATDRRPTWRWNDDLINRVVIRHRWEIDDDGEYDFREEVEYNDSASQSAHDEAQSEEIEDFAGPVYSRPADDLRGLALSIFRLASEPRLVWSGRVGTYKGILLGVGSVALVTSPHLTGYLGQEGVTGAAARVISQRLSLWDEGCDLELVHVGSTGTGWNAALKVEAVIDATTIQYPAAAVFAPPENPVTGAVQTDIDLFRVGDSVRCEDSLAHDIYTTLTITGIDTGTRRLTLSGVHGLAVGDTIIAAARGSASDIHAVMAYYGDGGADDYVYG